MARMFPDEIHDFATPGEARVYEFIRDAVKPDGEFLCWYSPEVEEREPDFVLLSPACGLIVWEVKDWTIDQILELDPKSAVLNVAGREQRRKQPLYQARGYVNNILSLFSKNFDKYPCPVSWGAVFPHIGRAEWEASPFAQALDANRLLFWDDIREGSRFYADRSLFGRRLAERFPPQFPFELDAAKIDRIRKMLFPSASARLPARAGTGQKEIAVALDRDQENLARILGGGSLLVSGPAGSGKTLLLAARASYLPRVDKRIRRELITCFNLSLTGYIRRLVVLRGARLGAGGVDVLPFYRLCERIIGEKLDHINAESDYYDLVLNMTLEKLDREPDACPRWDAILVDEGQDFTPRMAEVIKKTLKPGGVLTVAQDENQRLYHRGADPWAAPGGPKRRPLIRQYRNARRIAAYAADFLKLPPPEMAGAEGQKPKIIEAPDLRGQIDAMADEIAALAATGEPLSEIAVLYPHSGGKNGASVPEMIMAALEERGILSRWLARDATSKSFYDVTTDSVTVSTVHSVKGMDFANVFIIDFQRLESEKSRRLGYVALTRARERLWLFRNKQ